MPRGACRLAYAAVADNAYSYTVALEKLPAGTDDGSGTRIDVEVFQANDARMLVTGNPSKFRLSIPAGQLLGAGRCGAGHAVLLLAWNCRWGF